jgi:hypothetical protein
LTYGEASRNALRVDAGSAADLDLVVRTPGTGHRRLIVVGVDEIQTRVRNSRDRTSCGVTATIIIAASRTVFVALESSGGTRPDA